MWCDEVEGERGWEEEGMMKSSSRQDHLEALFSARELTKLGKVNLATRELKTQ
jgi:hypothetical protein